MNLNNIKNGDFLLIKYNCISGYILGEYICNDYSKDNDIIILNSLCRLDGEFIIKPVFNSIINVKCENIIMIGKDNILSFLKNELQTNKEKIEMLKDIIESKKNKEMKKHILYKFNKNKLLNLSNHYNNNYIKLLDTIDNLAYIINKNIDNEDIKKDMYYYLLKVYNYSNQCNITKKSILRKTKLQKRLLWNCINNINKNESLLDDSDLNLLEINKKNEEIEYMLKILKKII